MSHWLVEKAKEKLGRKGPTEPPVYNWPCSCGELMTGLRSAAHQQIHCHRCGETYFVLPQDVYPAPKARPRKKKRSRDQRKELPPTEEQAPPRPKIRERLKQKATSARDKTVRGIRVRAQRTRALFTPFRLVVLAMLVIIFFTSRTLYRKRVVEQAQASYHIGLQSGKQAFDKQDYAQAATDLAPAVEAVDFLLREDAEAQSVRQMYWQSQAISDLLAVSPIELIQTAQKTVKASSPVAWHDEFQLMYRGKWLILQSRVSEHDAISGQTFQVDFPLTVNGVEVEIDAPLTVFSKLPSDSQQVIFAAKLKDCTFIPGDDEHRVPDIWKISCEAESGFLWTDSAALQFLIELPEEEEQTRTQIEDILRRQAILVGMVEQHEDKPVDAAQ